MRRSKSNPAKYARNYNSISQRRMTVFNEADDDVEFERIKHRMQTTSNLISSATQDKVDVRIARHADDDQNDMGQASDAPYYTTDNTSIILTAKRKKQDKASKQNHVELTQEETKAAKLEYKKLSKKLQPGFI